MLKKTNLVLILIIPILLSLQTGCASLTGYTIGSLIDNSNKSNTNVPIHKIPKLKEGKKLIVFSDNDTIIEGLFYSLDTLSDSVYNSRYQNNSNNQSYTPKVSENVSITLLKKGKLEGTFKGYDFNYTTSYNSNYGVRIGEYIPVNCLLKKKENKITVGIPLNAVYKIENNNNQLCDGQLLRNMAMENQLPMRSSINLISNENLVNIPVDEIKLLETAKSKKGKYVGLGIGIALDITAIIFAIVMSNESWGLGSGY
ncbi:hypothetical protein ACFLQG_00995 [Candidatus Zixiibacteriota bacterium]